ncbi:TY-Chap domain-containing protein [Gordonia sp. NPDC003424]
MTQTDFDNEIEAAWRRFRIDLGDRLAMLERGDEIHFGPFDDDPESTMALGVTSARRYRCRLRCSAHHDATRLAANRAALGSDGWRELRGGDMIVETGRRRVDHLADVSVRALREVCAVLHPSLMTEKDDVQPASVPVEPALEFSVMPQDATELHQLAVEALAAMTGVVVHVDDDGEIPLPTHPTRSRLRTIPDFAAMECHTVMCDRIGDPAEAALFLAANADRWPGVTVSIEGGQLLASMRIECSVFHPANLASALAIWFAFIRDHARDIEINCSPSAQMADRPTIEADAPAGVGGVLDLLHDRSDVDAVVVAAMCGYNTRTMLRYLKHCARNARRCQAAEAEALGRGDTREAARLQDERQQWWHTIRGLGSALKVVEDRRRQIAAERARRRPRA